MTFSLSRLRPLLGCMAALHLTASIPVSAQSSGSISRTSLAPDAPFSIEDELILELQIEAAERRDMIIAYARFPEVYLPFGLIARLLDLAVTVSGDGRYATGWVLDEARTINIESDRRFMEIEGKQAAVEDADIVAFDGEMYIRPALMEKILPVEIDVNLRAQAVAITTLATFPFQAENEREKRRSLLEARAGGRDEAGFARLDTPFLWYDMPKADVVVRAVSDGARGARAEGELYLAGDLAKASAEIFLAGSSDDGLTAALFEIGRDDPDGELFGPLGATSFAVGDVQSATPPIGLRSSFGRGFRISNSALNAQSIFDQIDLRGVLQEGFEVELYRNGILIGSTSRAVNGQYEFLEVPVDFGINVFRLAFYGPQGQQREEIRTIRVGDGRLADGEFTYALGVVQNEETLINARPSRRVSRPNEGSWRGVLNGAYGVSSNLTLVGSASFDQENSAGQQAVASLGMRSGLSRFGLRWDLAFGSGGGFASVAGINGQFGQANFTLNHGEYREGFIDEQRDPSGRPLKRASDLTLSATAQLNKRTMIPIAARIRRTEFFEGGEEARVSVRTSTRVSGFLASNAFEYQGQLSADGERSEQLIGSFDLSNIRRGSFEARGSFEYEILPEAKPTAFSAVGDWSIGQETLLQLGATYRLEGSNFSIGGSALTRLGNSTLALDGDYDFDSKSHSVSLRWGISFGRDDNGFFTDQLSRARMGAVEVNAFYDFNANGVKDEDEDSLEGLEFFSPSDTAVSDKKGRAVLSGLPTNRPTSIQVDLSTIPDISLVPNSPGFEIVPRRGRTHSVDFPIVSVGEVDGMVTFVSAQGAQPVGGVILGLRPMKTGEETIWLRSEADGYFYFDQIRPGAYDLVIDQDQAARLNICLMSESALEVSPSGGMQKVEVSIANCR